MRTSLSSAVFSMSIFALLAGLPGCIGLLGDFAVSKDSALDEPDSGGVEAGGHEGPEASAPDSGVADGAPDVGKPDAAEVDRLARLAA